MNGYILFSDLKGFSGLSEPEIEQYYKEVLPLLREQIIDFSEKAKVWNTWGDAIIAVFDGGKDACEYAVCLRDFFNQNLLAKSKNLTVRIGGHFGEFALIPDPLTEKMNAFGKNINTTSRIEPVTRPGEVFVSERFKEAIENLPVKYDAVKFDSLGEIPLAKNFGDMELFRMYRKNEKEQIIDKIYKEDLSWALPAPPQMTESEKKNIDYYCKAPTNEILSDLLSRSANEENTGTYLFEMVKLCKKAGLFEKALEYAERLQKWTMNVGEICIHPYNSNTELQKLVANSLTRLSKYDQAADIVYNIWQSGVKDSDTLAMLAAQYKRRALMKDSKVLSESEIDMELLKRASRLYIAAFRLNINDYYPAINAAYLYKIIGGMETGRGAKLARYISETWSKRQSKDWWLDATLAEAELLQEDYETATSSFETAISLHKPNAFEKHSTREQIYIYSVIKGLSSELGPILSLLDE